MSFTENPYTHMNVLVENNGVYYRWECDSCGGVGNNQFNCANMYQLYVNWTIHLRNSHKLTIEDTKDWS